jgi:Tfp pilus assembly protein PilO
MPRSFSGWLRDPARAVRAAVGVLLLLNVAAAALVLYPPGGSAESLEAQFAQLQSQRAQKQALLERTKQHVAAVEKGRTDGDQFLEAYFLARRTAYSTVLAELSGAARASNMKERENAFATEPVEGSDTLSMMTVTANYEGTYHDLMSFVREIDRSPGMLIIESLNAAPQTGSNTLQVAMKIQAFVRQEPDSLVMAADATAGQAQSTPAPDRPAQPAAAGGGGR